MRKAGIFNIVLIVFMNMTGFGIVLPDLQLYGQQYGINNYFYLTLIGAMYSLCQFVFAPILGRWSDHIGQRPVLIFSQTGTLIGYFMLFSADLFHSGAMGIVMIFCSQIVDGISGGNIANAYIADITAPEKRAKGMGALGAAVGLGFLLGAIIGGVAANIIGLHYIPLVAAGFSIAALFITWTRLAESREPNDQPDHNTTPRHISIRGLERILARPIIGLLILMYFVNSFAFSGMEQTLSLLVQNRIYPLKPLAATTVKPAHAAREAKMAGVARTAAFRKEQDDRAGTASSYLFSASAVVMVLVQGGMIGRLTEKYGELKLAMVGPVIISAGLIITAAPIDWKWRWMGFLIGGALLAVGSGLFGPSMSAMISRHCHGDEQGEVLGAVSSMTSLAGVLGPILAGLLFEYLFPAMPYYVSAGLCLLVTMGLFINRTTFALPAALIPCEKLAELDSGVCKEAAID